MIDRWLEIIASKLRSENVTQENYTHRYAITILSNCVAADKLIKILTENENEIIAKLNRSQQQKLF